MRATRLNKLQIFFTSGFNNKSIVAYLCSKQPALRVFLYSVILFFVPLLVSGQQISIMSWEGEPISDVYIVCDEATFRSDANGKVEIPQITDDQIYLFQHPNFRRKNKSGQQIRLKNYTVVLFEKDIYIDEIKVHSLKREQLRDVIPGRVIPMKPELLEQYNPQTSADLLGTSGEVFIQKSQMGGGSPMIRGFSANRILLVFDGVRMNNAIYRSGNLHNIISVDAQSLGQVDVVMGPGSVMYGSDALGGVLSFQSRTPQLSTSNVQSQFNTKIRYASANSERTMHVDFNIGGKKLANYTSITFSSFGDQKMGTRYHKDYQRREYVVVSDEEDKIVSNFNPNKQYYTAYDQTNIFSKLRYHPSDQLDLSYSINWSSTSNIPRYDRLLQYSDGILKYAQWYYGPQQWFMQNLQANYLAKNKLFDKAKFIASFQNYKESRHSRSYKSSSLKHRYENVNIGSFNLDFDKNISDKTDLFYGIEGIYNKINSEGKIENVVSSEVEPYASRYPDGSNWWSSSLYTMLNQHVSEKTELQAGIRYNATGMSGTFSDEFYQFPFSDFSNFNHSISGSVGYALKRSEKVRYNVSLASGFRAPNIDDVAKVFDSEPGTVIVPNPDLKPEYAVTTEAGIWLNPAERTRFEISCYYTRLFNAMVRRDFTLNGLDSMMYDGELSKIEALINASGANIYGASLRTDVELMDWMTINGAINWQKGHDDDGWALRHIAPVFGDLHLKMHGGKLELDWYTLFNGAITYENLAPDERAKTHIYAINEDGNPYSPAWITFNMGFTYKFSRFLKVSGGVENIMDVRYRPYSSGLAAPGRNVVISLIMNLK